MGKQLILAEKPIAAAIYAKALSCNEKKKGYYEGKDYIVSYAVGHLFTLKEPQDYDERYAQWKFEDLPIIPEKFFTKPIEDVKSQYYIIKSLIEREDVTSIVNGGDPGIEGELIQRWILYNSRTKKPIKRLWILDLEEKTIRKGMNELEDISKYDGYYHAANTRSKIDWLWGMNFSRAYTTKLGGKFTLSVGRTQTSILNLIVKRDLEIENFKSVPFFEVISDFIDFKGKYIDLSKKENASRLFNSDEAANIVKQTKLKSGKIIKIKKEEKRTQAPALYNLTDLKKVMFNKYGYTEDQTTKLAQSLYESHKILSYPRTSSNHLTNSLAEQFNSRLKLLSFGEYRDIISNIDDTAIEKAKNNKAYVDSKKVTDHYALIPTDNENMEQIYKDLSKDEKVLFDEIVMRFLAIFYGEYKFEKTEIITAVNNHAFITTGKREIALGWKKIYKDDSEEELKDTSIKADLSEGQTVMVQDSFVTEGKTKPPMHYNTTTILSAMQQYNIGTEATRDNIPATLIKRSYIKREGKNIISTKLGRYLISIINIDEIKSPEFTGQLEAKLNLIIKGELNHEEVFQEAKSLLNCYLDKLRTIEYEPIEIKSEPLGKCPKCKQGEILERKTFYGCSNYESGCNFGLKKQFIGANITESQIRKLLDKNRTDLISFETEKGKFKARLTYNRETGKIDFMKTNKGKRN